MAPRTPLELPAASASGTRVTASHPLRKVWRQNQRDDYEHDNRNSVNLQSRKGGATPARNSARAAYVTCPLDWWRSLAK